MPDLAALCKELELTWHRDIPLAAAMSIGVAGYDGRTLTVRAPLPPNRNLHGSAFAGSLFSTCVLTGWGATWLALREQDLTGVIVVADSDIHYRKPSKAISSAAARPNADPLRSGLKQFKSTGRATFDLICAIDSRRQTRRDVHGQVRRPRAACSTRGLDELEPRPRRSCAARRKE